MRSLFGVACGLRRSRRRRELDPAALSPVSPPLPRRPSQRLRHKQEHRHHLARAALLPVRPPRCLRPAAAVAAKGGLALQVGGGGGGGRRGVVEPTLQPAPRGGRGQRREPPLRRPGLRAHRAGARPPAAPAGRALGVGDCRCTRSAPSCRRRLGARRRLSVRLSVCVGASWCACVCERERSSSRRRFIIVCMSRKA